MMILVYRDFITIEEQEKLEDWATTRWDELHRRTRYNAQHKKGERRSRDLPDHPDWVIQRIIDKFGFDSVWLAKLVMHEHGARRVYLAATHGILCGKAPQRLQSPSIDGVVITDTIPLAPEKAIPKIKVLSVAPLLGEAIKRIHRNESVSSLFV